MKPHQAVSLLYKRDNCLCCKLRDARLLATYVELMAGKLLTSSRGPAGRLSIVCRLPLYDDLTVGLAVLQAAWCNMNTAYLDPCRLVVNGFEC